VVVSPSPLVRQELVAWFEFSIHGGDFGTGQKNQKTYGRFLGTIFLEGFQAAVVAGRQGVGKTNLTQKWKNTKKSVK